ncbi:hypothetical protein CAPTEDRAFT_127863, partial [Capitella teleta]
MLLLRLSCLLCCASSFSLLMISDLSADFPTPVHPRMHTPYFDLLAKLSFVSRRAYVQHAVCSPSRISLLTGHRLDTTHVYDLNSYWRKVGGNYTTLP